MSSVDRHSALHGTGLLATGLLFLSLGSLLIGERVLGSGGARQLLSGLALFGLLAALLLRTRCLLAATGDARQVQLRALAGYGGALAALVLYALSRQGALDFLALAEEPAARLAGALGVLWTAVMAVSLTALVFMEISYARMPVPQSVELRRVGAAAQAGLTLALSAVFLLSVNYVATERDIRRDVTYFKTTEPSRGTLDLVERLDRKLRVLLFYRATDDVLGQLRPYFDRLARASNRVSVEVVDFAMVPKLARKNRIGENGSVLLLWGEGDGQKGRSFKVGLDLRTSRGTLRELDGRFQEHFRRLTLPRRTLHLTVGHGERNAMLDRAARGDGTRGVENILGRLNIKSDKLGVAQGLASAVPDEASAVAVLGPREPFLPEEAEALLSYLRKGGRLLLMLDPDRALGLEPLLEGLGVELLPGVVSSEKNHLRRSYNQSDRTIVYSNGYSSHPTVTTANRHRNEVATVLVGGAALGRHQGAKRDPAPRVTFPLRGTGGYWRDLDGDFTRDPEESAQPVNLMAAVSLEAAGGPEEQKARKDKASKDQTEGRAVIIGDGDFATDKLIGNLGNTLVLVDSLAWLIADEQIAGDVASEEDIPIEHTRDENRIWFYATCFGVPLPILAFGIAMARRRRRRSEART